MMLHGSRSPSLWTSKKVSELPQNQNSVSVGQPYRPEWENYAAPVQCSAECRERACRAAVLALPPKAGPAKARFVTIKEKELYAALEQDETLNVSHGILRPAELP